MLLVTRRSGDPPTQRLILGYELIYELDTCKNISVIGILYKH